MDTSWWPALVAVVVIALVVAVAGGRTRSSVRTRPPGRPSGRTRPPARKPGVREPRAREIWWAEVPFEDGPGSKDRPCLVLSVRRDSALVAKITSKYHDERPGVIALPPGAVGDARGRASFLETDELRDVPLGEFRRRVGEADPVVWDQVRHLAR
ncbi:type II toxin-antitoxin system PemK/MazF family toxin [Streptomyces sp. R302]|uniref:type II toxin-antitoxin system PemK/MazF family toxin n=1 Tax=unclassified Streptomyces TaxID=2593676 RepID=UPI00145E2063|nr:MULTISPECIES: type II toxin-antitoxin system PemK/MazF family toxin [unclassified Streptomyces]NML48840.1 type II toxin-antitoxin system PemK/MazF family toxin [Streptomyces sp. R301]NML77167.1 type II toxin-antitoxin system PemK/MazF family toxin [Streptomyces sp. R302]